MNLNDNVEEGLDPSSTLTIVASKPDRVDNKSSTEITPEQLFKSPIIPNTVPELDAQFVVFQDLADHHADITEIKARLDNTNAISKSEALAIEEISPGFISSKRPLAAFTIEPTTTMLKMSKESLDSSLDIALGKIIESLYKLQGMALDTASAYFKTIDDKLIEASLQNTAAFLEIITKAEISDTRFIGAFEEMLNAETGPSLPILEKIKKIVAFSPTNQNVSYYLKDSSRPVAILERDSVAFYIDGQIVKYNSYSQARQAMGFSIRDNRLDLKDVLDSLFGGNFKLLCDKFKLAISSLIEQLKGYALDIKEYSAARFSFNQKCLYLINVGGQIKSTYIEVALLTTQLQDLFKLNCLMVELIKSEIAASQIKQVTV